MHQDKIKSKGWLAEVFKSVDEETDEWPVWMLYENPVPDNMISSPWNSKEIEEYQRIRKIKEDAKGLYSIEFLRALTPEKTSEFLAGKVISKAGEYKEIKKIAREEGRPAALRKLEEMFVAKFS